MNSPGAHLADRYAISSPIHSAPEFPCRGSTKQDVRHCFELMVPRYIPVYLQRGERGCPEGATMTRSRAAAFDLNLELVFLNF
jgi:hypothetical protein